MLTATDQQQLPIDVSSNRIRLTPHLTAPKAPDLTTPATKLNPRPAYGRPKAQ